MSRTKKKDVGMGLFVQRLYALSLHLVAVVFGTAIPTSLNIFGKCFIYFIIYCLTIEVYMRQVVMCYVPYCVASAKWIRGCCMMILVA